MNKKSGLVVLGCVLVGVTGFLFWPKRDESPVASTNVQKNNKTRSVKNNKVRSGRTAPQKSTSIYAQAQLDPSKVSPELAIIAGLNPKKSSYKDRMDAIRTLDRNLDSEDISFLRTFLAQRYAGEKGMTPRGFNAVKNDVLDILLRQDKLVDGMGYDLVDMFKNENNDEIWRDYVVQYMAPYYQQKLEAVQAGGDVESDDHELAELREIYQTALEETHTSVAGTALIGLESLAEASTDISIEDTLKSAKDIANNTAIPDYNRITAMRLCGKHNLAGLDDIARPNG